MCSIEVAPLSNYPMKGESVAALIAISTGRRTEMNYYRSHFLQPAVSNIYSKQLQKIFQTASIQYFFSQAATIFSSLSSFNSVSASFISSTFINKLKYPKTQSFASPYILKGCDQQSELRLWSLESDQVNSRSDQKVNDPQLL